MNSNNSDLDSSNQFLCITNDDTIDMDEFIEELDNCWEESVDDTKEDFNTNLEPAQSNTLIKQEVLSKKFKSSQQAASIECPLIQEIVTKNKSGDEENSVYHCSSCDVHLHNVMCHIKKFHKSQSVIIKSIDDNEDENDDNKDEDIKKEDNLQESEQYNSLSYSNQDNIFVKNKILSQNNIKVEKEIFYSKKKIFDIISENEFSQQNSNTDTFLCDAESVDENNTNQCSSILEESIADESMDYNYTAEFLETAEIIQRPTRDDAELEFDDNNSNIDLMEVIVVNEDYVAEKLKEEIENDYITLESFDESENFEDLVVFNSKQLSPKNIEYLTTSDEHNNSSIKVKSKNSPISPEFRCEICFQILKSKYQYRVHQRNYHPSITGSQFKEKDELLCSICNTYFPSARNLALHRKMHNMSLKMTTLEEATRYSSTNNEKLAEFFYCDLCDKKFDNNLRDTHKKFHDVQSNEFLCGKCNRNYPNIIDYTYHMKIHEDDSEIEKPTKRLTKAEKLGIKLPYECTYCGRTFSRPYEKVKHERIHTGEKPFKCEVCGKCFRVSYSLTLHLRTHTNNRPYACSVCNKRFKSHGVYAHHLLTHSEERNFKCDECPKAFKTSVQLHGHKNSHKKPFNCLECNRKFASMFAVKFHMETHKKVQIGTKYSCNICGAMYAREYALKDHLKEAHNSAKYKEVTSKIIDNDFSFIEEGSSNSTLNEEI